ncbi:MAG: tetracycline resistance efflux pump, partial [Psychroserpens sp.]
MQDSVFSLLPPLVAIIIAIWRKKALFALLCGVTLCYLMIANGNPIEGLTGT